MSNNHSTARHFSRAAAIYDTRAELQRTIAGKLMHFLSGSLVPGCILELGCGTGFLTKSLLEQFPLAHLDAIDISASMIEQARQAVAACERAHWHVCDVWNYRARVEYDLISSSSSLQWMQPLDRLFPRLATLLKPGGRLLCSLMVEGTLGELHRLRREIAPRKIPRDRLPTVPATIADLQSAGFSIWRSAQETLQTEHETTEHLLSTIRELGFTGGSLANSSTLLTRGELKRLSERYRLECALPGDKVAANYVVYYFEAFREKVSEGPQTRPPASR